MEEKNFILSRNNFGINKVLIAQIKNLFEYIQIIWLSQIIRCHLNFLVIQRKKKKKW